MSVSSIIQDDSGFLWFGTQGGLNRYDGNECKVFSNEPFNPESLSHNLVQTLYLDGTALWVGTYGGLNRLDLKTEKFVSWRSDDTKQDSLSEDLVVSICRDSRGALWVGTTDGLNRLDEKTSTFKRYLADPANPRALPAKLVRDLHSDSKGNLWVATSGGGLARYDPGTDDFTVFKHSAKDSSSIMSDFVMSIDEDSSGKIWLGTWYGGLSRLDTETLEFSNHTFPDDRIYKVFAESPDLIYAGSWGGGLFEFHPDSLTFKKQVKADGSGSLPHDVVYSLCKDNTGELWVGTNGGGVSRMSVTEKGIETFASDPLDPKSIGYGKMTAALVDRKGRLWVAVYNGGLNRYVPEKNEWKKYRRDTRKPRSLPNEIVNRLWESEDGTLWAGTNDGFAFYDEKTDDFTVFPVVSDKPDGLSSEIVYCFADAPGGNMWIGLFKTGLDLWDRKRNVFTHYQHDPDDTESISDNLVYDLQYDTGGTLWVATNHGLNRFEDGKFKRYFYDSAKKDGLSGNSIQDLFLDSRGILWIGSAGGGLMRYVPDSDSFEHFTKPDGLPSNDVVRIIEDRFANLWIATQSGIVKYDRQSGAFMSPPAWIELDDREFNKGCTVGPDGTLYFGSLGALFKLNPSRSESGRLPPRIAFSSVTDDGEPIVPGTASNFLESIHLKYDRNEVEFAFSAMDFRDPSQNRYSWKLEGFDKDWVSGNFKRTATYTNLPGGRYVFRVKASNSDGVWNETGIELPVTVETAPWFSLPAWIAYLATLAFAAYQVALARNRAALKSKVTELLAVKSQLESANVKLACANSGLEEANAKLEALSRIDPLTGIANRRRMEESLESYFARSVREKESIAILMIDIDKFKGYNDSYGHQAGDDCLRRVAAAITASLDRSTDSVARYGGEEFIIILPNTEIEGAKKVAEKTRLAVLNLKIPHPGSGVTEFVSISIGCAAFLPERGAEYSELVKQADFALYDAKHNGRNRVSV